MRRRHRVCLRDKSKREVDFLATLDGKPWFAAEAKTQDREVSANLRYFREKLKIPHCYQVLKKQGVDMLNNGVRVISADKFLSGLL